MAQQDNKANTPRRERHMIDLVELERQLREMEPRQQLYELIKAEMVRRGRWKKLPRGPFKK